MKKVLVLLTLVAGLSYGAEYKNGVYRGTFVSGQETQVEVQFNLKNDEVTSAKYRTLFAVGRDYLTDDKLVMFRDQYQAALDSTVGQNVDAALDTLYTPSEIENAGATIRATKVRAAMKNALNVGAYRLTK